MKRFISRNVAVGIASLALAAGTLVVTPGVSQAAGYRSVTANSLTLWNAPSGGANVGTWSWGRCFYWTVIEGSNRYRTFTESGATVWVSADPSWSASGC